MCIYGKCCRKIKVLLRDCKLFTFRAGFLGCPTSEIASITEAQVFFFSSPRTRNAYNGVQETNVGQQTLFGCSWSINRTTLTLGYLRSTFSVLYIHIDVCNLLGYVAEYRDLAKQICALARFGIRRRRLVKLY